MACTTIKQTINTLQASKHSKKIQEGRVKGINL